MTEGILNYTEITAADAQPRRWLYLLHGIYGSGRNWGTLARRLVDDRPEWGMILADLRLHGGSTGFSPPHTVEACAEDLARLETHLDRPADAVLGHSFGGKVALLRAANPSGPVPRVWVADSTLGTGAPSGTPWRVIEIVRGMPDHFESREQVADELERHGYARGIGMWLAMNLERDGDALRWRLDWDAMEALLRDYFATDVWPIIESPPPETRIDIIKAADSDAIDAGAMERIEDAGRRTGRVFLHAISGGHWMNVDNPDAVLDLLAGNL